MSDSIRSKIQELENEVNNVLPPSSWAIWTITRELR